MNKLFFFLLLGICLIPTCPVKAALDTLPSLHDIAQAQKAGKLIPVPPHKPPCRRIHEANNRALSPRQSSRNHRQLREHISKYPELAKRTIARNYNTRLGRASSLSPAGRGPQPLQCSLSERFDLLNSPYQSHKQFSHLENPRAERAALAKQMQTPVQPEEKNGLDSIIQEVLRFLRGNPVRTCRLGNAGEVHYLQLSPKEKPTDSTKILFENEKGPNILLPSRIKCVPAKRVFMGKHPLQAQDDFFCINSRNKDPENNRFSDETRTITLTTNEKTGTRLASIDNKGPIAREIIKTLSDILMERTAAL